MKKVIVIIFLITLILVGGITSVTINNNTKIPIKETKLQKEEEQKPDIKSLTISAVGDCTIGSDAKVGTTGHNNFNSYLVDNDYAYYFRGVHDILSADDITIANLEGTFTDATEKAIKNFNFKNTKDYVNVLSEGSVEIVNVANNHTYDYKEVGYLDTLEVLNNADIGYFGYSNYLIEEVNGIKIGFAGLNYYDENYSNYKKDVKNAIDYLKEQSSDLIVFTFHWGIEATYNQTAKQTEVGRYAIDMGADLVLGHHPHRIQGIELYKDKYIVYSLSNFVFGGHRNPDDKDSFIYQQTFTFNDNELSDTNINIIPVSISGKDNLNNYQPVILSGSDKARVFDKINKYSINFKWSEQ